MCGDRARPARTIWRPADQIEGANSHLSACASRGRSHRRDPDGGDRDGRDPHSQAQGYGLEMVRGGLAFTQPG